MVIDANVLSAWYLETGQRHDHVLHRLGTARDWRCPPIWRSEFNSVLMKHVRRRGLQMEAAITAHAEAESAITLLNQPDPEEVLPLALHSGCSTYDCEYVVAARNAGLPLYTFDKKLIKAFPNIAREP
ncbi:MAG: putative nucleic acid-binding protein [Rhodothermales bacterium]|jgi:predicted nucleic acid-binding protein